MPTTTTAPRPASAPFPNPWAGPEPVAASGFALWAEALRAVETPDGPIAAALLSLVVLAAGRLDRSMSACRAKVGDTALLREEAAAQRLWSRSLAEWRRHKAAIAAAERIASRHRTSRASNATDAEPDRVELSQYASTPTPAPESAPIDPSAPSSNSTPAAMSAASPSHVKVAPTRPAPSKPVGGQTHRRLGTSGLPDEWRERGPSIHELGRDLGSFVGISAAGSTQSLFQKRCRS